MSKPKFYLTTPIYYVNARPHIGHAYTTIAADVIARRHRLLGDDTFFLTGTDEHGQKVERSAAAAGVSPQEFADKVSASFKALWDRMGITYDDYIRTTESRHTWAVQKLFPLLCDKDAIYLSTYTGQYSVGEEMFVDGPPGTIGPDGKPTETVTEENYFFRLSKYQAKLIDLIENDELKIQPDVRKNEVLSFLYGDFREIIAEYRQLETPRHAEPGPDGIAPAGPDLLGAFEWGVSVGKAKKSKKGYYVPGALKDLSISRTSFKWGIPVPGNEKHVIYVWLDALANYMTAIGYGSDDPVEQEKFKKYWPADLHLVGKEIIRFHCVYWPAFLLAADLPLPKAITAHGWLLFEDSKMSKSRGNIVRTETILDAFGTLKPKPEDQPGAVLSDEYWKHEQDLFASDVLRYFLLREIPFGQDGSFSFDALVQRYNSDLADGYGNLVSRTLNMINKFCGGKIPFGNMDSTTRWRLNFLSYEAGDALDDGNYNFSKFLENAYIDIAAIDGFLSERVPWKLAKLGDEASRKDLENVLYSAIEGVRLVTIMLYPVMPFATSIVWSYLGLGDITKADGNNLLWASETLNLDPSMSVPVIFPRIAKKDIPNFIQLMTDMENNTNTTPKPEPSKLMDEKTANAAPVPADPTHPGAPPRTSEIAEENPGSTVGGSHALTTERPETPSHTEAPASGVFATSAATTNPLGTPQAVPQIAIDDFVKIDLRVAQIVVAERIPKSDKLLRLEVDLGYEKRQILSGIAEWYTPEELIGRRIVVIANLAPRKMRGLESHGMLLAASHGENGKPILATFGEEIALGSRLK